jgi:glycosyltransferase involved in cell wall biosynthesis
MRGYGEQHGIGGIAVKAHAPKKVLPDLICLSHLRWDFVYQRPQHLMARWARERRVFFFEEPLFEELSPEKDKQGGYLVLKPRCKGQLVVVVPHLQAGLSPDACRAAQQRLIDKLILRYKIRDYLLWYCTPMSLPFTRHLKPSGVIYDCMDERSTLSGAPKALCEYEAELFVRADVVLTGGHCLYEAKCMKHDNVHPFPNSVDRAHFARARTVQEDPPDQADIPRPRLGFLGVIDERMDLELVSSLARARPDWQIVLIGPVKIPAASLPRLPNIHCLGMKSYEALPAYLAGWDVALLPFAHNPSTRFICPTKILEYLAAGKPVISTSICDVVRPYGQEGLVRIADTLPKLVSAIESALREGSAALLPKIDAMLAQTSWDLTWQRMKRIIDGSVFAPNAPSRP